MKKKLIIILIIVLRLHIQAHAHRLNEYLQASVISIEKDRLVLRMHLTAGEEVAGQVLKSIDKNADGIITAAEQNSYVKQVQHDIRLSVDGKIVSLQVKFQTFPTVDDIKNGMGDILITFQGGIPIKNSAHQLVFTNQHQQSLGVYLVNCLEPADSNIHIVDQYRNYYQTIYRLSFTKNAKA